MFNFYFLPEAVRLILCLLAVINAGFAALVLLLHLYRRGRSPAWRLSGAAAFFVLCQTVLNAALIAQVYQNILDGYIVASEYIIARYVVFAALAVVSVQLSVVRQGEQRKTETNDREQSADKTSRTAVLRFPHFSIIPGIACFASFLTLPFVEALTGSAFPAAFPAAFSVSLAILLAGSIWLTVKIRDELRASISGLSVKQAMDSLGAAVIFYRKNGHILMQNNKMQDLMLKTSGRVFYNGKTYLDTIVIPNSESAGRENYVYRVPDSVWQFSVRDVIMGKRTVTRIIATDVTEQDKAAAVLRDRHDELNEQQQKLKAFVDNIEEVCRSEEMLRVKTEIHDTQNKRLITLLLYLRYGELPDSTSFESLKDSILKSVYAKADPMADPRAMLNIIVGEYESIGIKIRIDGSFPFEKDIAIVFVQVLQEAAANSVRHGYASEVYVSFMDEESKHIMRVADNGTRPVTDVKEGVGIANMRRQLTELSGTLSIAFTPGFTLTASVPADGSRTSRR